MKIGYLSENYASGIDPATLARELEERGFESLWLPEHSHLPVGSLGSYPAGNAPDFYAHIMDPFISLMAAASVTSRIKLGTGVCLPLTHDLMDFACTTATLDVLSGGRLLLGCGVGWNEEELKNHCPSLPFSKRYSALRERIAVLRAAWGSETTAYSGMYSELPWGKQTVEFRGEFAFNNVTESWSFPKPERGTIPIGLGFNGPLGMRHTASYADFWLPSVVALARAGSSLADGIESFRRLVEEAGRDPGAVTITLNAFEGESDELFEQCLAAGVDRLVMRPPAFEVQPTSFRGLSPSDTLKRLDRLAPFVERFS